MLLLLLLLLLLFLRCGSLTAFSWPPAEWSLPANGDARQTEYQQGVVYSLEYELQVQQVDVGPPSDSAPAEHLLQQVFGALSSSSWRCVASVVGPMQSAVQVSTFCVCSLTQCCVLRSAVPVAVQNCAELCTNLGFCVVVLPFLTRLLHTSVKQQAA